MNDKLTANEKAHINYLEHKEAEKSPQASGLNQPGSVVAWDDLMEAGKIMQEQAIPTKGRMIP